MLLSAVAVTAFTQDSEPVILTKQFEAYRNQTLPEKLFVHTDKELYVAGEIMWFKLYAVDGYFNRPLDMSKVAYVEVLDIDNNPLLQAKIKMTNADGNGSLFVPVTINSGNYKLRAYTNWMKNAGPEYFFEKKFTIINTQKATATLAATSRPMADIRFYPEGGNLVTGINSKVAFELTNGAGKGLDAEGVVINKQGETVTKFRTGQFGIGNFNFTPAAGQQYTAEIVTATGDKIRKQLPEAFGKGYVLSLNTNEANAIQVIVKTPDAGTSQQQEMVYLFAHTRGVVKAAMSAELKNNSAVFYIDPAKLGDGISHFTVFNESKKPVCERLYFKYPAQKLDLSVQADAPVYQPRKKIGIQINAMENNQSANSDLSMAVYRIDSLEAVNISGINEYLLLGSDLVGNIESPGYYFSNTGKVAVEAMDNLMLTKGWRRFRWEDVAANKKPLFQYVPEYNGHIVYGKVVNTQTGTPARDVNAYLSAPGGTTMFRTSVSDENGRVKFEMKNLLGGSSIIAQTHDISTTNYQVQIDNPFLPQYTVSGLSNFSMPQQNLRTLLDRSIGVQVENAYTGDKRRRLNYALVDTNTFYYHPNEIYLLDNYTRFTTMEEVLREYIFSVNVRRRDGKWRLPVYNDADRFNGFFDKDPLVLLDGVPVFDIEKVMRYDPLKVRRLEAVTRNYFYGNVAFPGIVNMLTYNGDLEGLELDPNTTVIDYEGLQLEREFYSPVYETPQQLNSHSPDFRNVLNWSPAIKTGSNGKWQTSFYSSDLPGKYMVIVQGLSNSGKAATAVTYFEVKKP